MNLDNERSFLEEKSCTYRNNNSPISEWSVKSYIEVYKKYIEEGKDKIGLELGCSNGYSTEKLSELLGKVIVVDGSQNMIKKASKRVNKTNVKFEYSLFEEIKEKEKYDYVFCSYILEHVIEPSEILKVSYNALKTNGKLFITVPNAKALSRQMAVNMGLLNNLYELTENDIAHGHRRVFDLQLLTELVDGSDFELLGTGGTFVKQFADFQLNKMIEEKIIGEQQLIGMQKLAEIYPDISGSIYAILLKK